MCLLNLQSTHADQTNILAYYDAQTNLLILQDVFVSGRDYQATLQNLGQYVFKIKDLQEINTNQLNSQAYYNETIQILTIPYIQIQGLTQTYNVTLHLKDDGLFYLNKSTEVPQSGSHSSKFSNEPLRVEKCDPSKGPIYPKGTPVTGGNIGNIGPGGGIIFAPGLEVQPKDASAGGETCRSLKWSNSECAAPDGSIQHFYKWEEAKKVANSYGAGWHLPTQDELILLCQQQSIIGGFDVNSGYYWSSSEFGTDSAWIEYFFNGYHGPDYVDYSNLVRAVRDFSY